MPRDPKQQALFERSGKESSWNPLVSFLYELMRDHVPPGIVEGLLDDRGPIDTNFTNGWLARYAKDVAARLSSGDSDSGYSDGLCPKCGARPGESCDPGLHG